MVNLPKYPKLEPLTVEGLRKLSLGFRDWYFAGGGLFLSESENPERFSESSRERYFDFQEGCKIVLQKIDDQFGAVDPTNAERLRNYLGWDRRWKPSSQIIALVEYAPEKLVKEQLELSGPVVELLRFLASALRASMTKDVLTRQSSSLSETAL